MNRYTQTENKYRKWAKEGRGQGRLDTYRPWLTIQDVPSYGRSHRVLSATNGRVVHLFSDLEFYAFLVADWECGVSDIREQYPLSRDLTCSIADSLNVRHPQAHQTEMVMTTDLLLDQHSAQYPLRAIQVKPSAMQNDPRTEQKLVIEKRFWESMNISFKIVTEKSYDTNYIENLRWLHPARFGLIDHGIMLQEAAIYREVLPRFYCDKLTDVLLAIDQYRATPLGYSLGKIRELFARKYFSFPMGKAFYTLNASDVSFSRNVLSGG
jgi:hypothetical protein